MTTGKFYLFSEKKVSKNQKKKKKVKLWLKKSLLQKNMNKFCGQPNIYNSGNVKECLKTPNAGRGKEAPHLETSDKAWPY